MWQLSYLAGLLLILAELWNSLVTTCDWVFICSVTVQSLLLYGVTSMKRLVIVTFEIYQSLKCWQGFLKDCHDVIPSVSVSNLWNISLCGNECKVFSWRSFRYPSRKRLEPHQSEKVDLTALICVHLDSSLLLVNLPSYSCALRTYLFAANACFDGWALNHGVNSHEHFMKVQR
jgi:hypothetical protein